MFLHGKRRVYSADKVHPCGKNCKLLNDDDANHHDDHQQEDQILKIPQPTTEPHPFLFAAVDVVVIALFYYYILFF